MLRPIHTGVLIATAVLATSALATSALGTPLGAQQPDPLTEIATALLEAQVPAGDDPDVRARQLIDTAIRHQESAAASLLIVEARTLTQLLQRPVECFDALEGYQEDAHGLGAHQARLMMADLLRRTGDEKGAESLGVHAQHATTMLAIGPFGDSGDHFTGMVFPCELRFPSPGAKLAGRYGPVRVRTVKRRPIRGQIDLAPGGERRVGCYYGLHQIVAEAHTPCYVEVNCRGSFELFLNGENVFVADRHVQRMPVTVRVPVSIPAGHNHVLVKTTLNGFAEVGLRYLDAAGTPISDIREVDVAAASNGAEPAVDALRPHTKSRSAAQTPGPFPDGLRRLSRAAEAAEADLSVVLAAAITAFQRRDHDLGMQLLHRLEQRDLPSTGMQAIAFARLLLDAAPLPDEIRRARARTIIEANAAELADHHYVTLQRATFLQDQDRREDAIDLLQARVRAGAAGPETFEALHRLLTGLEFDAEARQIRELWRGQLPRDVRPVLTEAGRRARQGDPGSALTLLLHVNELVISNSVRQSALNLARNLGRAELALQLVDEIHALEPNRVAALQERARTMRALGRDLEATALEQQVAEHPEATAAKIREAGNALLRANRDGDARTAYQRSLSLDPAQRDLRRQLARLADQPEYPLLARFRRDGDAIITAFTATDRESASSSSLLLDQMIVQVFEDGSSVQETHQIRRINDLRGVEQHQEATSSANAQELILLRTIPAVAGDDGPRRSYKPVRVAGNFSMPRLEPGAFIEQIYRNSSPSPRPDPWRGVEFHFRGNDEPYLLSELVVILPATMDASVFRTRNHADEPDVVEVGEAGQRAYVFRRTDVPRLPSERNRPPVEDIVPVVAAGEDGHPGAQARALWARAKSRSYITPILRDRTAEVVDALAEPTDLQVIQAIHRHVHDIIADGNSSDPTGTLLRRRGARFFLEAAMFEIAGIPLQHAAVAQTSEEISGAATPFFLGDDRYEVPAVKLEPKGGPPLWLFADLPRYAPLGLIPAERLGAAALLLRRGGAELTRLERGRPELGLGFAISGTMQLQPDGSATMEAAGKMRGAVGYFAADRVRTFEENVQKLVARQIAGETFPGWTLQEVGLGGFKEKGRPLTVRAEMRKGRALEPAGEVNLLGLPLGKTEFLGRFGDRGARTLPFVLAEQSASSWRIEVDPGESFAVVDIPTDVRVRHMLIDFTLSFRREGGVVVVQREMVQRPGVIAPAQFGEWLALLRKLDLAEDVKLVLAAR